MNRMPFNADGLATVRCVVLSGDDTMSRDHARATIVSALSAASGPVVREVFDPSAGSFADYLERMMTPSLFGERRIFHVRHAQTVSEADLATLDAVLDGNLDDMILIIEIDPPKKDGPRGGRKDAPNVLKLLHIKQRCSATPPTALHEEYSCPPHYKVAEWLTTQVPRLFGRSISQTDAEHLADRVGSDPSTLFSELKKIDMVLDRKSAITRESIDHITGRRRRIDAYELAAALGRRNSSAALAVVRALFETGDYVPLITSIIARHFWALLRIRRFLAANPSAARAFSSRDRQEQNDAAMKIGLAAGILHSGQQKKIYPAIIKSEIVKQARGFSDDELAAILSNLLDFDLGIKTGKIEKCRQEQALGLLCSRIATIRVRSAA